MLHPRPRGQSASHPLQIDPAVCLLESPHSLGSRVEVVGQTAGMPLVGCSWLQWGLCLTQTRIPVSGGAGSPASGRRTSWRRLPYHVPPISKSQKKKNQFPSAKLLVGVSRRPCYQAVASFFCIILNMTSLSVSLSGIVCYLSTPCKLLNCLVFRSLDGFLSQHGTRHAPCIFCGLNCPTGSWYTPRRFMKISPSSRGRALASPSS